MIRATPIFLMCTVIFAASWSQSFAQESVKSRDEQCVDRDFLGACRSVRKVAGGPFRERCDRLICAIKMNGQTKGGPTHDPQLGNAPAEGTECGAFKVCRGGKCQPLLGQERTYKKLRPKYFRCSERNLIVTAPAPESYDKDYLDRK